MKKSGVSNILLGVESGYSPALECINKTAGIKENLEAKHRLYSVGISVGFSFMFGFPYDLPAGKLENEHKKEIVATMKTIGEFSENYIPGDYYLLFLFTPYPGVRLFERYKMLGYTPPDKLEDWGTVNLNETGSAPWISEDMIKVYKNCLRLNWVFMHKISRNFFRNTKNNFLKRQGLKLDKLCRKAIRNRVNKGKLAVPFYVVAIQTYYAVKNTISKNGFKYFIKKIIKVFK